MTITIGFTCKEGIVVASDSQMSYGEKYKQCDTIKVFPISFANSKQVIVAIAGSLNGADSYREIFGEMAGSIGVSSKGSILDAAESALKNLRNRLLGYMDHALLTPEDRREHLDAHDFVAILAFYFEGRPYLYEMTMTSGRCIRKWSHFHAVGCGKDIAGYILTGANLSEYAIREASGLVFYAIEACKKFDQACGGEIQSMIIYATTPDKATPFPPSVISIFSEAIRRTNQYASPLMAQMISNRFLDHMKELEEKSKAPEKNE